MVAAAERMLDGWEDGQIRNAHADMTYLAFEVAAACRFGADLSAAAAAVSAAVDVLERCFNAQVRKPAAYAVMRMARCLTFLMAGARSCPPRSGLVQSEWNSGPSSGTDL
jgi:hypothetical protein